MCLFITLIVPSGDAAAVRAVMERHGRAACPIHNPSVCGVMHIGEHQYLTTRGHCDCATVLARPNDAAERLEEKLAKEATRMRRKGWSEAKVARAIEDRRGADGRPKARFTDSLDFWSAVLHDLGEELSLPYAGLFLGSYSGGVATELMEVTRREAADDRPWDKALATIEVGEVTIFRLS
jgi:hypothetical protein